MAKYKETKKELRL